jgi:2-methylcitrate dehydratase PrpD
VTVTIHPRARQAAPYDDIEDGLAAKFSIPYTVAYTLLYGLPLEPARFDQVDAEARRLASERVRIRVDESLPETAAVLAPEGREPIRVQWATGSPARPMTDEQLQAKLTRLAGTRLEGILEQEDIPLAEILAATGLV